MTEIVLSTIAYAKILLHAQKYPHCGINGVLLAKEIESKDSPLLLIEDAIPLFHNCLNVTPMAEVALLQIDHWASKEGYVIAGYYEANENQWEPSIEKINRRIPDKIAEIFPNACYIAVLNYAFQKFDDSKSIFPLKAAVMNNEHHKWQWVNNVGLEDSHSDFIVNDLIQSKAYDDLVDFDNHLDDINLCWRNETLNKNIAELCE